MASEKEQKKQESPDLSDVNISGAHLLYALERLISLTERGGGAGIYANLPVGCDICGTGRPARYLRMVGGYNVILCNKHANEWSAFSFNSIEYQTLLITKARLDMAIRGDSETVAINLANGLRMAEIAMYRLGEDWITRKGQE